MGLSFLPENVKNSIDHLNYNFLTEIRLRQGQPVVVEYKGKYTFLGKNGLSQGETDKIYGGEIAPVVNAATGGCVYNFTEQMKSGFITVEHGVRIGLAGEYVTENGKVNAIKSLTSLNIRIPHEIYGISNEICRNLFKNGVVSVLVYSKPGLGKTTMLRDIARNIAKSGFKNVLILDERGEIAAMDGYGEGYDLGGADVVRCFNKLGAAESAIRAMKPDVIITDELYGDSDVKAVKYAADCGIAVIASSHVTDKDKLKLMPFDYFVQLTSIGGKPLVYDKNFNSYSDNRADDGDRGVSFGG